MPSYSLDLPALLRYLGEPSASCAVRLFLLCGPAVIMAVPRVQNSRAAVREAASNLEMSEVAASLLSTVNEFGGLSQLHSNLLMRAASLTSLIEATDFSVSPADALWISQETGRLRTLLVLDHCRGELQRVADEVQVGGVALSARTALATHGSVEAAFHALEAEFGGAVKGGKGRGKGVWWTALCASTVFTHLGVAFWPCRVGYQWPDLLCLC